VGSAPASSRTPLIKASRGRFRDVHPLLWVVAALFVIYFAIEPIERLLGVR